MSRINPASSASGVRVAAQPLSNIYTVLLIIGLIGLLISLIMVWVALEKRYGVTFAVTDEGKTAVNMPTREMDKQKAANAELDAKDQALKTWGTVVPATPATTPVEAAPAATGTAPATDAAPTASAAPTATEVAPTNSAATPTAN
jgi:hypothetical protein